MWQLSGNTVTVGRLLNFRHHHGHHVRTWKYQNINITNQLPAILPLSPIISITCWTISSSLSCSISSIWANSPAISLSIICAISSGPPLMPISAKIMLRMASMSALEGSEVSGSKLPNKSPSTLSFP